MTDKEIIRAEIERRMKSASKIEEDYKDIDEKLSKKAQLKAIEYHSMLMFIDSLKEEPEKCMYSNDNYTEEDRKVLCDGCEEKCKYIQKEEPVDIDAITETYRKRLVSQANGMSDSPLVSMCLVSYKHGIQDILSEQYFANSANISKNLQEEPVSEELEEYSALIADELPQGTALISNGEFDIASVRKLIIDACKLGANWQKQQDQSTIELAEDHAMLAGMEKMKEKMMEKTIDVEVKVDAGGYPYIPQMELYDYDKDIPLAKEGDKYKVVLIKEE